MIEIVLAIVLYYTQHYEFSIHPLHYYGILALAHINHLKYGFDHSAINYKNCFFLYKMCLVKYK